MHPNPVFRTADEKLNLDFARERSFGSLAVNAEGGPLISHVPFILSADGKSLEAHLMHSNPIVTLLESPQDAVFAVSGGDSYVSPDWYQMDDQVPTWSYVAVHIRGRMRRVLEGELPGFLQRLSQQFEKHLMPKPIWRMDKVNPEAMARMLRMIVPVVMDVSEIEGTWKLAQNKPDEARKAAAEGVAEHGLGLETKNIAALLKNPPF